jgi:hypothetical protein
MEYTEEMGGTTPLRADKSGWSCCIWPKNTQKKKKKTIEKHVEEEGEIRKGEKVRGKRRRELLPILSFKIF